MNRLRYTLLSSMFVAGTAIAQWATPRPAIHMPSPYTGHSLLPALSGDGARAGGDVVFSEDFANGLSGNNGVGAWTLSGPHGNIWKRTTGNPVGAWISPNPSAERIQSTTVGNGFMIFNSDSANCNCVSGGAAVWPENPTNWDGALESPVIDLSATPYVEVLFEQRLRWCCSPESPHAFEVSTDGGATWPFSYPAAPNAVPNELTATRTERINITEAIANDPSNVKIRFKHLPIAGSYHWQIDDVRIVELFPTDLRLNSAATTSWDPTTATTYDSIRYTTFPISQLRPLGLNMTVMNNGAEVMESAVANFLVRRQTTTVLDQDQPLASLAQGETRKVFVDPSFTPPAVAGPYTVTFSVDSDEEDANPADNTNSGTFRVSEHAYARDNGNLVSSESADDDPLVLMNGFYIHNEVDLHSISVALGNGSEIGALVIGELRDGDNITTVLAESNEISVAQSMLNNTGGNRFVELIFEPPVTLQAGKDYMASIQVYGNVSIGTSGTSERQTSFIYTDGPNGLDWYYTTSTPMIRMNFDPTVGIDEMDATNVLGLGQNIPNPANGTTTIPYELKDTRTVGFQVHDVTGKVVAEEFLGTRPPGIHRFELNTEALREGVYFYTLAAGETRVTKRMIVVR